MNKQDKHQMDILSWPRWGFATLAALTVGVTSGFYPSFAHAQNPTALAMWVQMGPAGVTIARVITAETNCPSITLGTMSQPMRVRARPSPPDFPVLVCETIVPPGTDSVSIEGRPLPLPKAEPQRVVVVADTGCRLKPGVAFQACNDPEAWPWQKIAQKAARWKPDLVIHIGDYLYRQNPCPSGNPGCAGSPWGDNWATWKADFFAPGAELLRAAPWVVTRGNHEECKRSGKGWFRFLDPNLPSLGCRDFTAPYTVPAGDVQLVIFDSASAEDEAAPRPMVDVYAAQFAALNKAATANTWLITHHPVWGIAWPDPVKERTHLKKLNLTLQTASANTLAPGIKVVLSAHIHFFEVLNFANGRPPTFIVGNSGTEMIPPIKSPLAGMEVGGTLVADGFTMARFGFMTMEGSGETWIATMRDPNGKMMTRCKIANYRATCAP
jgi:hypothetical protein